MNRTTAVLSALALLATPFAARAAENLEKPVKTLVTSVRYGKDAMALKFLDGEAQGAILLGDEWAKADAASKAEFISSFHQLFAALAFPNIRQNFEHLETTLYAAPTVNGDKGQVVSTIVILHPLKKQEIKVQYDLIKRKDGWKVVDVTVLGTGGNSMLTDIRNDQVKPLFAKGGWAELLRLMKDRLTQLQAQKK